MSILGVRVPHLLKKHMEAKVVRRPLPKQFMHHAIDLIDQLQTFFFDQLKTWFLGESVLTHFFMVLPTQTFENCARKVVIFLQKP